MKLVTNRKCRALLALACALICATEVSPLHAQTGSGTITGTVVDQAGKAVEGAIGAAKVEGGLVSGTANTDSRGRFSITGLAPATY